MDLLQIESEALSLPPEERASLAHRLLLSLEDIPEAGFERLWGEEAAKRAADVDAGRSPVVPAEEVARKARALFR